MPQVRFRQSIAANATEDINLAPNDRFGPAGGKVELFCVTIADGDHRATLMVGTDVILDRGFPNVPLAPGVVDLQRDKMAEGFGAPFDPITLRIENTTVGAVVCSGLVNIT